MLLTLVRRSFVAAISCISSCVAHGSRHFRRTASVASSPLESIPGCALSCVKIFIESDYPTNACASLVLDCLCRTNTRSGYTLGEAALRCNLSFCPMAVTESSDVYNICDSVAGAVLKTHATITATVMSTIYPTTEVTATTSPSTLLTTSTTTMTTTDTKATTSSSTSSTLASFETPLTVTHIEQTSPRTTSDQPASSSSTATSSGSGLNAGAVIGVSVTSGVAGFFILGVIIFFCCRRIRRQHEKIKDRDFFEIGGVMSEPPDFGLPLPRRPILGPPNPFFSAGSQQSNSETARLMSPFKPATRNPAVVVTGPDDYHFAYDGPDRIGFAVSTNSEFGASPSQTSERTVSDLLPDKPNMNLYPKPLRWSSHKPSRHMSSDTLFEEDAVRPRSLLGSSSQNKGSMGGTSGHNGSQQYRPTMGLPSNPRAMLYGMGNAPLSKKNVGYGAKPVFANTGERIAHYQQAEICNDPRWYAEAQMPDQQDYIDSQWLNPRTGYGQSDGRQSTRGAARRSVELVTHDDLVKAPTDGFETISLNDRSELRRKSRHSGDFKPLTPVREVVTPSVNAGKNDGGGYFGNGATVPNPRMPFSAAPPVQEIISRPRIVRGDDIKRVQIRKGKPQPHALRIPYSPEDGWLETRGSETQYSDHEPKKLPVDPSFPVESMAPATPRRKPVSWGRNLTPARRGSDLILRVD
ncbi:uncharacterized protein P174DRAFT_374346 [Aspergillus novofumigatus IBT 16806]|uniref:Extracellular membrane protein CFEM domain-containing protein n=1 Tax=Aspergillus novofumigatus (strain IBT 16806) TaxID=1392255 RepID=A0A2I1C3Q5_ASPN1|nr:uncharacterized protein P174DRAFT_374346 [Aspergillus novofumigatus IBT 16806]PKX92256.1 hypothetical protein P174DRAFT_374346 [Aspergillus novofumigatus IBT 16806]